MLFLHGALQLSTDCQYTRKNKLSHFELTVQLAKLTPRDYPLNLIYTDCSIRLCEFAFYTRSLCACTSCLESQYLRRPMGREARSVTLPRTQPVDPWTRCQWFLSIEFIYNIKHCCSRLSGSGQFKVRCQKSSTSVYDC